MISKLSSLSVLQNERKREVDLESVGLMTKHILNDMVNGFSERAIGVTEVSKVDS